MGSSGVQQLQRINDSQQHFPQPNQQDFIRTPDHRSKQPPPVLNYYSPSSPQQPSFPLVKPSPPAFELYLSHVHI
ncbi:hypothetical protein BDZ45DRAFT_670921 [Acephala macrosclerotiorum]|nr:hypothetical protein BDZ45DRAFT_670921 [Acephala macrosclerotiorum]